MRGAAPHGPIPALHDEAMRRQAAQAEQHPQQFLDPAQESDSEAHVCRIAQQRKYQCLTAFLAYQLRRYQEGCALDQKPERLDQQRDYRGSWLMQKAKQYINLNRPHAPSDEVASACGRESPSMARVKV